MPQETVNPLATKIAVKFIVNGINILGLYTAALKKGLPAVPVKTDLNQLARLKSPAIAFVDGGHFLVVHKVSWWNVTIQDPPDKLRKVSKKEFLKRWNGEALVFSEKLRKSKAHEIADATAPTAGPHIILTETEFYAGTVNEGDTVRHTFRFTNTGATP